LSYIGPQGFRWQLSGDAPPPLTAAFRVGTATRAAIYRGADARGLLPLPDSFHAGSGNSHDHAFWLTEADDDGRIDHVLLFAASGLPYPLLPVLAESWRLDLADLGHWRLQPDWMGQRVPGALFGPARRWVSVTAYVTPLNRARQTPGGDIQILDAAAQLRWEIGMRRLGSRLANLVVTRDIARGRKAIPADNFTLKARKLSGLGGDKVAPEYWRPPSDAEQVGAELIFSRPVWGPLAFGFGAHFGLGLFEPVE
jgi:CRISPR-associated protein Csb2